MSNPLAKHSVLLAEDNTVHQRVTGLMLRDAGCEVDIVTNGEQAWQALMQHQALHQRPYDLVCMDCQMPEVDGFEGTRLIREWEAQQQPARHTPIIALTAQALHGDREQCLAAGMDDYLSKPLAKADLQAMLDKWLSQTGVQ